MKPPSDPHAIAANPLLLNPGHAGIGLQTVSGYALRANSPAIDSGRKIESSGGRDFFGNPVPSCGGVDRGAIESVNCGRK